MTVSIQMLFVGILLNYISYEFCLSLLSIKVCPCVNVSPFAGEIQKRQHGASDQRGVYGPFEV